MKKTISIITAALMVAVLAAALVLSSSASAESHIVENLLPNDEDATLTGCTLTENADGSVTVTLTAATATIFMELPEDIAKFDLTVLDKAYFVYSYKAEGAVLVAGSSLFNYTRKDKTNTGTALEGYGNLYVNSMQDLEAYQIAGKYGTTDGVSHCVWDLGGYVNMNSARVFPFAILTPVSVVLKSSS